MHRLRHSRNFGRFLAAWLLAWFGAMCFTAPARGAVAAAAEDCAVAAVADGTEDMAGFAHATQAGHEGHAAHAGHEPQAGHDAHAASEAHHHHHGGAGRANGGCGVQSHAHDAHAGHATGSSQHCPLCLHAAVPPPPQFEQGLSAAAPIDVAAAVQRLHPRVRTDVPPPARAPPLFS